MVQRFSKGFKQFVLRCFVFIGLIAIIQLILAVSSYEAFILSNLPKFFIIVDLATAFLAGVVLLFIVYREEILKIKEFDYSKSFFVFFVLTFILYFFFTKFIFNNLSLFENSIYLLVILRYIFLFFILFFLILAVFGKEFIKSLSKKGILLFFGFVGLIYFFIQFFHSSWSFFSHVVTKSVYFLLSLNFNAVVNFSQGVPIVGIDSFRIGIAESCSGISSLFLFMFLYVFSVCYDWKIFNKKKVVLMFFVGFISVFCLNILRVYLIILIGAYISKDFAVGIFHTGIAGVLFVIYFAIFWKFSYKFLKK
jgi:exosortase/archaeosortase family protein